MSPFLTGIKNIFTSRTQRLLFLFVPVAVYFTVAYIYFYGAVREIPVAVLDLDNSATSRLFIRSLDATGGIKIAGRLSDPSEIHTSLFRGNLAAVYLIPAETEKNIKRNKTAVIKCYRNSVNLIVANVLNSEGAAVVKTISAGIIMQRARARAAAEQYAYTIGNPFNLITAPMFNPNYNYEYFMTLPLFLAMYSMALMLAGAIKSFNEKKQTLKNTFTLQAASLVVSGSTTAIIITIGNFIFPHSNPPFSVTTAAIVVVGLLTSYTLGLAAGIIANTKMFAAEIAIFISTPAFIFSGYTFPAEAMPPLYQLISAVSPFTWFMQAFIRSGYMDSSIYFILKPLSVMLIFYCSGLIMQFAAPRVKKELGYRP